MKFGPSFLLMALLSGRVGARLNSPALPTPSACTISRRERRFHLSSIRRYRLYLLSSLRTADSAESLRLWNQQLSKATYTPYNSTTYHQTGNTQPPLGVTSSLCLSCHDGTVAVGPIRPYGKIQMIGSWTPRRLIRTGPDQLSSFQPRAAHERQHPICSSGLVSGRTADPLHKVRLINGNIECTSCHDPHVQDDRSIAQEFLVRDSSSGQMCLACHDPNRDHARGRPISSRDGTAAFTSPLPTMSRPKPT